MLSVHRHRSLPVFYQRVQFLGFGSCTTQAATENASLKRGFREAGQSSSCNIWAPVEPIAGRRVKRGGTACFDPPCLRGERHRGDRRVVRRWCVALVNPEKSWQRGEPLFLQDECINQCQ